MTIEEYQENLQQAIANIDKFKIQERGVIQKALDDLVVRLFEKGQSASGKTGNYRGGELWVSIRKGSPRALTPRSKPGSNRTATKTRYFPSYRAFKQEINARGGIVDLTVFRNLKDDFQRSLTPTKDGYVVGVKRKENVGKVNGLQGKYGIHTFMHTQKEITELNKKLSLLMLKYLTF